MKEFDNAIKSAGALRSAIAELKAKVHIENLDPAIETLDGLDALLETAQKAAKEDNDPLVRLARGEPLTEELAEALSVPE